MENPPITNFEKFEKIIWSKPWSSNCELFWRGMDTYHFQRKNNQREGIEIRWEDNPFELDFTCVLEK